MVDLPLPAPLVSSVISSPGSSSVKREGKTLMRLSFGSAAEPREIVERFEAWRAKRATAGAFPVQTRALVVRLGERVGAALQGDVQLLFANGSTQGSPQVNDVSISVNSLGDFATLPVSAEAASRPSSSKAPIKLHPARVLDGQLLTHLVSRHMSVEILHGSVQAFIIQCRSSDCFTERQRQAVRQGELTWQLTLGVDDTLFMAEHPSRRLEDVLPPLAPVHSTDPGSLTVQDAAQLKQQLEALKKKLAKTESKLEDERTKCWLLENVTHVAASSSSDPPWVRALEGVDPGEVMQELQKSSQEWQVQLAAQQRQAVEHRRSGPGKRKRSFSRRVPEELQFPLPPPCLGTPHVLDGLLTLRLPGVQQPTAAEARLAAVARKVVTQLARENLLTRILAAKQRLIIDDFLNPVARLQSRTKAQAKRELSPAVSELLKEAEAVASAIMVLSEGLSDATKQHAPEGAQYCLNAAQTWSCPWPGLQPLPDPGHQAPPELRSASG
jgi:hypothetical protein